MREKALMRKRFVPRRVKRVGGWCKPSRRQNAAPLSCAAEMLRRFPAVIGNEVPGGWPGIQVEPRVALELLALNRKNRFGAFLFFGGRILRLVWPADGAFPALPPQRPCQYTKYCLCFLTFLTRKTISLIISTRLIQWLPVEWIIKWYISIN